MRYLCGRVNGLGGGVRITGFSLHKSLQSAKIMDTILHEANAGALTTQGQAQDRLRELAIIDLHTGFKS